MKNTNLRGVLWATGGVGIFALIYVSGRLSGGVASALQIMWLRYIGGFITMSLLWASGGRDAGRLSTNQRLLHACRAATGGYGGVAAVYAAANMPVASASSIGLLDGLFTVFLGVLILSERVTVSQWTATLFSLGGALIVVGAQGAFSQLTSEFIVPAAVALLGALLVSAEGILIKTLVRSEPALVVLFYVNLFGCLFLAVPGLAQWSAITIPWSLAFLALGPLAIVGQYCNIRAYRLAAASVVGPIRYTWIIYGALFGALIFNESVTPEMLGGIGLVLFGGVWLALLRARP